jgi:hypothetical protein
VSHGLRAVWHAMMRRCTNPDCWNYHRYGGRGITVCDRWRESFDNFIADMGVPPSGHTLERINNDGPYSPENCRWATRQENARNTRWNCVITALGKTQTAVEWAGETGISAKTITSRIQRGWDGERAVTEPPRQRLTAFEVSELVRLRGDGVPFRDIAARLGRTVPSLKSVMYVPRTRKVAP